MNRLKLFLATCGGLGLLPGAPGTWGTLGGVAIAWALARTAWYPFWILAAIAAIYLAGRWLGDWAEAASGGKDPQHFVLDEVAGYLVTALWTAGPSPFALAVAFFVFRFFDIWKPALVRRAERLQGGDGIMLDDVVAGLYGLVLVMLPARLLLPAPWTVS